MSNGRPMSDEKELATRLSRDVHGTFPEVVSAYEDVIYSIALRTVNESALASELAADTFVKAYGALIGYEPRRIAKLKLRPWIVTIALNACRNAVRSNRGQIQYTSLSHAPEIAGDAETPERVVERRDEQGRLVRALREIPDRQRSAVVLRYVADMPYDEIAIALHCPLGTAKSDVSRGLVQLRKILERTR